MEGIRVDEIVMTFGKVRALDGVSVEIGAGELFFLLGPSGCGKTTLLRCIAGLEEPDEGRVWFGDRDVTRMPPHKREAAMVFQSYALWPHMTVGRNVAFGLEERGVGRKEVRERVAEVLAMVRLEGFGDRSIDEMSGGQQQRVALARALVVRPRCLLLDEPLSNLDAQLRIEMRREIRRIVKENDLTAVYVTHDQEEALAMADRMAVLTDGRVEQIGSPGEIYRNPVSGLVAAFIGETNFIDGKVLESDGATATVETVAGPMAGRLSDPAWRPAPGDAVSLSIRPEAWTLEGAGENRVEGRVVERVYLGQYIQYLIETPAGPQQLVEMNPRVIREPGGQPVPMACSAADAVVVRRHNQSH